MLECIVSVCMLKCIVSVCMLECIVSVCMLECIVSVCMLECIVSVCMLKCVVPVCMLEECIVLMIDRLYKASQTQEESPSLEVSSDWLSTSRIFSKPTTIGQDKCWNGKNVFVCICAKISLDI